MYPTFCLLGPKHKNGNQKTEYGISLQVGLWRKAQRPESCPEMRECGNPIIKPLVLYEVLHGGLRIFWIQNQGFLSQVPTLRSSQKNAALVTKLEGSVLVGLVCFVALCRKP